MDNTKKTFEYKGLHFIPAIPMDELSNDDAFQVLATSIQRHIAMCDWSHSEFYSAAGDENKKVNVFYCEEFQRLCCATGSSLAILDLKKIKASYKEVRNADLVIREDVLNG